ncbi:hypothetical protein NPS46_09545 [Pseudomonas putida]|uniref:hypothetical protein n=1 Tax=Pseudomonas putida TaxID=303 RepID=UPI0023634D10|nr:hypothetical protein [Pseudomonas putida]MDD2052785.1 hypothetical protein [Pseudomonas putida]
MPKLPTSQKIVLLHLPIAISEQLWSLAIDGKHPELNLRHYTLRLYLLIKSAHKELLKHPNALTLDFWVFRIKPSNKQEFPEELHLQLRVEQKKGAPSLLRIALKDEVLPTFQ